VHKLVGPRPTQPDTKLALTELAIKNAKAGAKIVKLLDGGGLQLWITPDGAKRWRKAYRFNSAPWASIPMLACGTRDMPANRQSASRVGPGPFACPQV
jgi:hypothetical protein